MKILKTDSFLNNKISCTIETMRLVSVMHFFSVLKTLDACCIESVVIAYDTASKSSVDLLSALQELWPVVEHYVQKKKICSVGVSDIETDTFIRLYEWAMVRENANI